MFLRMKSIMARCGAGYIAENSLPSQRPTARPKCLPLPYVIAVKIIKGISKFTTVYLLIISTTSHYSMAGIIIPICMLVLFRNYRIFFFISSYRHSSLLHGFLSPLWSWIGDALLNHFSFILFSFLPHFYFSLLPFSYVFWFLLSCHSFRQFLSFFLYFF